MATPGRDTYLNAASGSTAYGNRATVLVDNDNPVRMGCLRFDNIFATAPTKFRTGIHRYGGLTVSTSSDSDPIQNFHFMCSPGAPPTRGIPV